MPVSPIPEGYHSVTPYLIVKNAAAAIEFYKKALGAAELFRMEAPGGKIGHAEIRIGDSHVMLADEYPDMGYKGPESLGGTSVHLMVYVSDVDKIYPQAIAAGGKEIRPLRNQFYGGSFRNAGRSLRPRVDDQHPRGGRFRRRDGEEGRGRNERSRCGGIVSRE